MAGRKVDCPGEAAVAGYARVKRIDAGGESVVLAVQSGNVVELMAGVGAHIQYAPGVLLAEPTLQALWMEADRWMAEGHTAHGKYQENEAEGAGEVRIGDTGRGSEWAHSARNQRMRGAVAATSRNSTMVPSCATQAARSSAVQGSLLATEQTPTAENGETTKVRSRKAQASALERSQKTSVACCA